MVVTELLSAGFHETKAKLASAGTRVNELESLTRNLRQALVARSQQPQAFVIADRRGAFFAGLAFGGHAFSLLFKSFATAAAMMWLLTRSPPGKT